jgi:hypothetical protein
MMAREAILCEHVKGLVIYPGGIINPLVSQLCTRTYEIRGKKFCLETKKEMKTRTLGVSPDHADAFCYMMEMARRHGLQFKSPEEEKREEKGESATWASIYSPTTTNYGSDSWGEADELLAA